MEKKKRYIRVYINWIQGVIVGLERQQKGVYYMALGIFSITYINMSLCD